jgi:hypothetical protein
MKKTLTLLALVAGATIVGINPAAASSGSASASCGGGLSVNLSGFPAEGTNHVRIEINSRVVVDANFGTSFSGHYTFPQNGLMSDWEVKGTATVRDQYQYNPVVNRFGVVGPCGASPKPRPNPAPNPGSAAQAPATAPQAHSSAPRADVLPTQPEVKKGPSKAQVLAAAAPGSRAAKDKAAQEAGGSVATTVPVAEEFHPNYMALLVVAALLLFAALPFVSAFVNRRR